MIDAHGRAKHDIDHSEAVKKHRSCLRKVVVEKVLVAAGDDGMGHREGRQNHRYVLKEVVFLPITFNLATEVIISKLAGAFCLLNHKS